MSPVQISKVINRPLKVIISIAGVDRAPLKGMLWTTPTVSEGNKVSCWGPPASHSDSVRDRSVSNTRPWENFLCAFHSTSSVGVGWIQQLLLQQYVMSINLTVVQSLYGLVSQITTLSKANISLCALWFPLVDLFMGVYCLSIDLCYC